MMGTTLYLAPMQGVTGRAYRTAYLNHFKGFDAALSPLIAACNATGLNCRAFKEVNPGLNNPAVELIPQLLGNNTKDFIHTAQLLFKLGHKKVNWNLGCPYPMVVKKGRGAGLLAHPGLIVSFLKEVISNVPLEVSLKVRLGVNANDELYALLPRLDEFALESVIIHPRLARQLYGGRVDLDGFEKALTLTRHTVVYSGDIYTAGDFSRIAGRFDKINKFMLGRGGVADPFLAEKIRGFDSGDPADCRRRFKAFHDELLESYRRDLSGPAHLMDKMKELWGYWGLSFPGSGGILKKIVKARTIAAYQAAVNRLLSGIPFATSCSADSYKEHP